MPLFENHVGVSLSSSWLRLVELVYSDNVFVLENVDEVMFDEKLNPSVIDENFINILQTSFQKFISNKSLTSRNISFTLDPEFFQILEVPFDHTLLQKDLTDQFKWELSKVKPMLNPEEYLIQHIELEQAESLRKNYAAVLFLNKKISGLFGKITQENDFHLRYIDYSQSSANILIRYLNKSYGSSGMSLILSDNSVTIMIMDDYKPVVIMKKRRSAGKEMKDLLQEVFTDMKKIGINFSELSYSFLVGNEVNNEDIALVNKLFGVDIKLINPFEVITVSDNFSTNIDLETNPSRFAPSAGVALRLF